MSRQLSSEVIVVGSGAGASAVAGELAAAGVDVLVLEAGSKRFDPAGAHIRNVFTSEDDLSRVADVIYDEILTYPSYAKHPIGTLFDLKVAHILGGMFSLWMGNCPVPDPKELPEWLPFAEWAPYFDRAHRLMLIDETGGGGSAMFASLLSRVEAALGERQAERKIRPMPLAAQRNGTALKFTSANELFFRGNEPRANLRILTDHIVQEVLVDGARAIGVKATNREAPASSMDLRADVVVVCGGTVGSAKILAGSRLETSEALGRYIHEHACIGSRVTLNSELRQLVHDDEPIYSIWVPYSSTHPWQNELCRFTLSSDGTRLAQGVREVDTSDIFTFVPIDVSRENRFVFDETNLDPFGLPNVSADFRLSVCDHRRISAALGEHFLIAAEVGDLDRGWQPFLYPGGGSTHFMGSCRMGEKDDGTSVVDRFGKLWGYEGIFVADNSVLGTSNAGNPTFTTVAQALRTADRILGRI